MMDEDFSRRPPTTPYSWSGHVLMTPRTAIEATLKMLQRSGRREACAFWYGTRDAIGNGRVEAVFAPRQVMRPGNYDVPAAAMSEMVAMIAETGWKPLVQVHSHPGVHVEHSLYDDKMVSSRRALSLVIPSYGSWTGSWPEGVGIHEHQNGYWHLLTAEDAARRMTVEAMRSVLIRDFRG